jgi:hypothetical protein
MGLHSIGIVCAGPLTPGWIEKITIPHCRRIMAPLIHLAHGPAPRTLSVLVALLSAVLGPRWFVSEPTPQGGRSPGYGSNRVAARSKVFPRTAEQLGPGRKPKHPCEIEVGRCVELRTIRELRLRCAIAITEVPTCAQNQRWWWQWSAAGRQWWQVVVVAVDVVVCVKLRRRRIVAVAR